MDRPVPDFRGFEIWENGDFIAYTSGTSQVLRALQPDSQYRFEVVGVNANNQLGGHSIIDVVFGEGQCR